jgi:hypothetical protein
LYVLNPSGGLTGRLTFIGRRRQPVQRGSRRGKTLTTVGAVKGLRHAIEAGVNDGRLDGPQLKEMPPGFLDRSQLFCYRREIAHRSPPSLFRWLSDIRLRLREPTG